MIGECLRRRLLRCRQRVLWLSRSSWWPRRRRNRLKLRDHRIGIEARKRRRQGAACRAGHSHQNRHRLKMIQGKAHREIIFRGGHADRAGSLAALAHRGAGLGSRRRRLKFDRYRGRSRKETRAARKNGAACRRDGGSKATRNHGARGHFAHRDLLRRRRRRLLRLFRPRRSGWGRRRGNRLKLSDHRIRVHRRRARPAQAGRAAVHVHRYGHRLEFVQRKADGEIT